MQLVVRVLDKYAGSDPHLRAKTTSRGDVIEVTDDDHEWGRLDLISPSWIILRAPISPEKAQAMKSGDQDEFSPVSRLRAFALDLDTLIARGHAIPTHAEARKVMDSIEAEAIASGASREAIKHSAKYARATAIIEISEADFDAAKTAKPPVIDPAIIG